MFEQYKHQDSCSECLHLFLHVHLIMKNVEISNLVIDQYHQFEMSDHDVTSYNEWVECGCPGSEKLIEWLDVNAQAVEDFNSTFGSKYKPKVEIWSDRNKSTYFKEKLQASYEFERYVEKLFKENYDIDLNPYLTPEGQYYKGENEKGIEIKNDTLVKKYGNIYIEYAEKSKGTNSIYVPSGILKDDNSTFFLIGDFDKFWIFRKARLVEIYIEEKALNDQNIPSARGILFKVKPTSLGFVYPIEFAEKETISLDDLVCEIKSS